jgi:hypothetical protein
MVDGWMGMEQWWNDSDRGNWSTGRKTLYSVGGRWMNEYGAMVEWYWQGKTKIMTVKPLPLTLINILKPTGYGMQQQVVYLSNCTLCPHCMCFVFVWEQTANYAIYIKNWFVFITEMKYVYSAVQTGPLNKAVCTPSSKG